MKPHGFYQKVSICIRMGMVRISVETTVVIYFTPTVCFVVVIKSLSYLTFCDPVGCSILGSSVLHYLLEFVQIHVH